MSQASNVIHLLPPESEMALALELVALNALSIRYVAKWDRWMLYDGSTWVEDETLRVDSDCSELCRRVATDASKRERLRLLSSRTVRNVVWLARCDQRIAAVVDQWDGDPFILNCEGEVHRLDQEAFGRPAIPGDYFTKSVAVRPEWSGGCPLWIEFLETVSAGDAALVDYLQRVCGYCLTGSTREQCLFFLYGPGANGKSTFVNTISRIMGSYAKTAAIDTFSASNGDRHPTELANLQGARLVTASETTEGRRWDETRIKAVTGGDEISARFMRQNFFEYFPIFKLMVSGNHKPELKGVDEAWRRRIQIVPFIVRIPPARRIRDYDQRLKEEWPGILAWMIEGARLWAQGGLEPPAAVIDATEEYLDSEDMLGAWIEECIQLAPDDADAFVNRQQLFESWQTFSKRANELAGSRKAFIAALNRCDGFMPAKNRDGNTRGYRGVRFRPFETPKPGFDFS